MYNPLQYLRDEAKNELLYGSVMKFETEIIDREKGVLCCYGS